MTWIFTTSTTVFHAHLHAHTENFNNLAFRNTICDNNTYNILSRMIIIQVYIFHKIEMNAQAFSRMIASDNILLRYTIHKFTYKNRISNILAKFFQIARRHSKSLKMVRLMTLSSPRSLLIYTPMYESAFLFYSIVCWVVFIATTCTLLSTTWLTFSTTFIFNSHIEIHIFDSKKHISQNFPYQIFMYWIDDIHVLRKFIQSSAKVSSKKNWKLVREHLNQYWPFQVHILWRKKKEY